MYEVLRRGGADGERAGKRTAQEASAQFPPRACGETANGARAARAARAHARGLGASPYAFVCFGRGRISATGGPDLKRQS